MIELNDFDIINYNQANRLLLIYNEMNQYYKDYFEILYYNAIISEGKEIDNPGEYVKKVTNLVSKGIL